MGDEVHKARRSWSEEFKRRVVAEAMQPGASAAAIAQRYDLNANLLFNWKRRYGISNEFLPVEISHNDLPVSQTSSEPITAGAVDISSLEIALANGNRISVKGKLDANTLCRLVRSLGTP